MLGILGRVMSRYRTIKPEFWSSGQILECSTNARLLFIGLWNFCDDFGRHAFSPKQIKAEIFPGDNFATDDIRRMLEELSSNGLIVVYMVEKIEVLQVTGWHHQKIDRPGKAKFPGPIGENSTNDRRTLAPESKGIESKGKSSSSRAGARETTTTTKKNKIQISEKAEPTDSQVRAAIDVGLSDDRVKREWTKFRDYNLARGSELADWDAAWRMWLSRLKTQPKGKKPNGQSIAQHYHKVGTPQWNAWDEYYRKSSGSGPPKDYSRTLDGGWWFETEWPPPMQTDA
jgi:hypothetical protein